MTSALVYPWRAYVAVLFTLQGVGSRVLKRQGWEEGQGVGGSRVGISEALENEGQNPRDKTGFG